MSRYKVIVEYEYDVMPEDTQEWLEYVAELWRTRFVGWLEKEGIEEEAIILILEEYE